MKVIDKIYNFLSRKITLLTLLSLIAIIVLSVIKILLGDFPFWHDPGRDLLLGLDNLKKPTLIGPPSGIPGIFYGPYWVWIISFAQLISWDPRIVLLIISTLPFFLIVPFLFFKYSKFFPKTIVFIMLFLLIFNFSYYTQIWSPNLAPMLYLLLVYITVYKSFGNKTKDYLRLFLIGFISAQIINFHVSYGIGILISIFVYFIYIYFFEHKKHFENERKSFKNFFYKFLLLSTGSALNFVPYLAFEVRHGFMQIKSLIYTFQKALFFNSSVVSQQGLTASAIVGKSIEKIGISLGFGKGALIAAILIFLVFILSRFKKADKNLSLNQQKLFLLLMFNLFITLFIYLLSKNPVWDYHFLTVEIIILFFIGFIAYKFKIIEKLLLIWVVLLILIKITFNINEFTKVDYKDNFRIEKKIVNLIFNDAGNKSFSYSAYNPAIYTYEYDYIFKWLKNEKYQSSQLNNSETNLIYLIVPKINAKEASSFISYKTPSKEYKSAKIWKMDNGISVYKRVK